MAKAPNEMNHQGKSVSAEQALQARRRLLKLGAYAPPAIIGMAIINSIPQSASASSLDFFAPTTNNNNNDNNKNNDNNNGGDHYKGHNIGSCMPSSCRPCIDSDDDDFHNGKKSHDDDVDRCKIEKAKKKYDDSRKD